MRAAEKKKRLGFYQVKRLSVAFNVTMGLNKLHFTKQNELKHHK
jgi:hypothetical protein